MATAARPVPSTSFIHWAAATGQDQKGDQMLDYILLEADRTRGSHGRRSHKLGSSQEPFGQPTRLNKAVLHQPSSKERRGRSPLLVLY